MILEINEYHSGRR